MATSTFSSRSLRRFGLLLSITIRSLRLAITAGLTLFSLNVLAVIPATERTALSNLYAHTGGLYWSIPRTSWNGPPGTECTWYGVTCDAQQGHVIAIDLTGISLTGNLPPLAPLSQLQSLKLSNNGHRGFNNLYGAIPELKALTQLREVDLGSQHFSGAVPELAGLSQLTSLTLSYNQLSGRMPALTGLGQLDSLTVRGNRLTGSLPAFDDLTHVTFLDFDANSFNGSVPALGRMGLLQYFDVSGNQLTGNVPSLSGLSQLREFYAIGNQLSGTLPTQISGLPNLQKFLASINFLSGSVPALVDVPSLQQFDVAVNHLTGYPPPPPPNVGFKEWLCPNPLTPASDPPTSYDVALNQVAPVTPWSLPCSQPQESLVRGTAYIDPVTADGKTVTVTAIVYGNNPTGTVSITTLGFAADAQPVTVCKNAPVIGAFATCRFQASAKDWSAQIGVTYSGDANNKPASYSVGSLVSAYQLTLSSNVPSAQTGQVVDLVATVTATTGTPAQTGIDPANTVSFYDGSTLLCSRAPINILAPTQVAGAQLNTIPVFTARCSARFDMPGDHALTVRYDNPLELGEPSAPLMQTVVPAAAFSADQSGLTGTWYNPATSGQGVVLEIYPDRSGAGVGELFGGWFTFDDVGNAQWRTLQGKMIATHGSSYALTIYRSSGGNFNAPPKVDAIDDGTATLTFHDCTHATLAYQLNDGRAGTIAEVRLTGQTATCQTVVPPIDTVHSIPFGWNDVAYSGAWYDPQTSGQGLVVDVVPSQSMLFAAWYTYAPQVEGQTGNASQRWFTLQAPYIPGSKSAKQLPVYAVIGGLFDKTTRTAGLQVGTADVTFTACNTMTLDYQFTQGEFAGASGSISEQKVVPNTGGACP